MDVTFEGKQLEAPNTWSFFFSKPAALAFEPGDYVELAVPGVGHRWLTIANAPSEPKLQFTTKLSGSSFKQALATLAPGDKVIISPALGSFNLPQDKGSKLILIAGGLGVTPYRSFLAHLQNQKIRFKSDLNLIYSSSSDHYLFEDLIAESPVNFIKLRRRVTLEDITSLPDWQEQIVYLAGPQPMCEQLYDQLFALGLPMQRLKLCYFPGYTD